MSYLIISSNARTRAKSQNTDLLSSPMIPFDEDQSMVCCDLGRLAMMNPVGLVLFLRYWGPHIVTSAELLLRLQFNGSVSTQLSKEIYSRPHHYWQNDRDAVCSTLDLS
jgi:hypothetical protein